MVEVLIIISIIFAAEIIRFCIICVVTSLNKRVKAYGKHMVDNVHNSICMFCGGIANATYKDSCTLTIYKCKQCKKEHLLDLPTSYNPALQGIPVKWADG
ncbi:hypothetical protein LCGC14_1725980 [marine sediment metagenome]|uniref:Uncharacterized protein n=1 Tax=marine sediment metagenome TaxID=412755 RepID=A0A0F9HAZ4_9ZZZZ